MHGALILLAERVGFEPTVPLTGHLISSSIRRYLPYTSEYLPVLYFQRFMPCYPQMILVKYRSVPRCGNTFSSHLLPTLLPAACQTSEAQQAANILFANDILPVSSISYWLQHAFIKQLFKNMVSPTS